MGGGGGARKTLCVRTHITTGKPEVPHTLPGSRTHLRILEALVVFDARAI